MTSRISSKSASITDAKRTFTATIHALFTEPRLWQVFGLGVASGFGFLIHRTPVTVWLVDAGRSRVSIGLFGAVLLPYAFNYIWAPLVDHLRIPGLARVGQLKSWLLLSLFVMACCTLAASFLHLPTHVKINAPAIGTTSSVQVSAVYVRSGDLVRTGDLLFDSQADLTTESTTAPVAGRIVKISSPVGSVIEPGVEVVVIEQLDTGDGEFDVNSEYEISTHWWGNISPIFLLALFMVISAFASATLDIATAGYRITTIKEHESHLVGLAASLEVSGWWAGFTLPAVVIVGVDLFDWNYPTVFKLLSAFTVLLILFVFFGLREPQRPAHPSSHYQGLLKTFDELILKRLLGPVIEFFQRNGLLLALCLLVFLVSFKLGEAFLGSMSTVFYREIGFANTELWIFSKFGTALITIPATIIAGIFVGKFKIVPTLVVAGISMSATNLMLCWMALVGDSLTLYFWTVVLDGITTAFSTVAFVTFVTMYTSRLHATTQYTAMSSIATSGRTVLATMSGLLINLLGGNWTVFFFLTAVWIVPVMGILHLLTRLVRNREAQGFQVKTYQE